MRLVTFSTVNGSSLAHRLFVHAFVALAASSSFLAGPPLFATDSVPEPVEGLWRNPAASVIIAIAPCERLLCGTVKWASADAQRDAAKGTRHLVGSDLITGLRRSGNRWIGQLFIPDENVRATARLQLLERDRLKVTGCLLMGLICDSQVWLRVENNNRLG